MLQDMAIMTGAEVITEELGLRLNETTIEQLGRAKKVKITKDKTIIVNGMGNK